MRSPRTQHPAGKPDWDVVARWEDAGRPPLNPDGTYSTDLCSHCGKEIDENDDALTTLRGALHTACYTAEDSDA